MIRKMFSSSIFGRFRIDNTDHIVDVRVGQQINIVCPMLSSSPSASEEDSSNSIAEERFVIYVVNKEEYDTCRIMDQHPRTIAKCDDPQRRNIVTITFRSFSPMPGGLEYYPGKVSLKKIY